MEIIRNLTRRKLRNFLTISGIVIGVLALVTMGALAEKFNALLAGGANYFGSNVQVRYNPQTGARDYVPVSPQPDPPHKG
jgi:ABC-type antimicrobial peptide transport system permease subunit